MMDKKSVKYTVDIGLAISFLIVVVTGLFKFPLLTRYFGSAFHVIPAPLMMKLHDWSGAAMVLFVFIHLSLNWSWIVAVTKTKFKGKK